ncbi:MAG: 3-deoxy-7-phosphoheptulonate synthase [Candidatus Woesearchaeota archaeon]|jgi:3-deoxy-7-phosphoheptulonate synthase
MSTDNKTEWPLVGRENHPQDTVITLDNVTIGGNNPPIIIAGPCSIESRDQIIETAIAVKEAGADILRGGAFKPRSSPYSFQGLGEVALEYLAEAGRITDMPTDSEAVGESYVSMVAEKMSIVHIGARNSKAYELLRCAGREAKTHGKAVLLKRGECSTIKEFLAAAEYIALEGCLDVILCLRGIRSYESPENGFRRYSGDIDAIPVLKRLTHLPIVYDVSHSTGFREYIPALCNAAIAAGANGLMIETHLNPEAALTDASQQVTPKTLSDIVTNARKIYGCLNR